MFVDSQARILFGPGRVSLRLLFAGWAVAEILAFALVVKLLGFGGAVLLSIGASFVGLIMLRRVGFEATQRLRSALAGGRPPQGALLDGMLEGLGALLLILPGFVSDSQASRSRHPRFVSRSQRGSARTEHPLCNDRPARHPPT